MTQTLEKVDKKPCSPLEYLAQEVESELRHEYIRGEIIAMTGGKPNHNLILGNLYAALNYALKRKPYRAFVTDQRLWIPARQMYVYPDVMVTAEPLQMQEGRKDTLVNPLIIAEVLSTSTRGYDCGDKFDAYRTIADFQEYLLIEQEQISARHYVKQGEHQWLLTEYTRATDIILLNSLAFEISLADLYDKVDFTEA